MSMKTGTRSRLKMANELSYRLEIFKMTLKSYAKDRKSWILEIFLLFPLFVIFIITRRYADEDYRETAQFLGEEAAKQQALGDIMDLTMFLYMVILAIFVTIVLGTSLLGTEKNDKTIYYILTRPIHRYEIPLQKFPAYLIFSTSLFIVPLTLLHMTMMSVVPGSNAFTGIGLVPKLIFIALLCNAAYGSIFMFIGLILKRPLLVALIIGFAGNLLTSLIFSGSIQAQTTIPYHLEVIGKSFVSSGQIATMETFNSTLTSVLTLISLTAFFVALTSMKIQKQDFE